MAEVGIKWLRIIKLIPIFVCNFGEVCFATNERAKATLPQGCGDKCRRYCHRRTRRAKLIE